MDGSFDAAPLPAQIVPPVDELQGLAWTPEEAKHRGIYGFDSRDARSRSFNLLRARVMRLHAERGWKTFGIVSASPGVGKSFIATNLAASLSRTPKLVTTLIDLDLRRGSVSRNFGYPLDHGIRAFLEGETDTIGELAFRLAGERLIVIPSDRSSARSAELLAGERMTQLIAMLCATPEDHVFIIDLPPVFANDDAAIVTSQLDAYIMIVEDGRTTKKQVRETLGILDRAECAGVVLNRYNGGLISDSYGYSYGSKKAYGDYYEG